MLFSLALLAALGAVPLHAGPSAEAAVERGNTLYYAGEPQKALQSYRAALGISTSCLEAWLNGGVLLDETGSPAKAASWYERASKLSADPEIAGALGWARWRAGDLASSASAFRSILEKRPDDALALLGLARVELASKRPDEALKLLERAAAAAPLLNLVPYYKGQAYELMGRPAEAVEAYRQTVIADSYFLEGREALGKVYLLKRLYNEAWRQFMRLQDAEPRSRRLRSLLQKIRPFLSRNPPQVWPTGLHLPIPYLEEAAADNARVPKLRVGIGTSALGRPRARRDLSFSVSSEFKIADAATGRMLAEGRADGTWRVRLRRIKKGQALFVSDPSGKLVFQRRRPFLVRPLHPPQGVIAIEDVPGGGGIQGLVGAGKLLRGDLEIAVHRSSMRLVNVVDLESYTQGVVPAEMPVSSPLEALKAQAVVARTHALFIKEVTRRHRRDGYDVCDGEHCQVYAGVRAESRRSREVVDSTRGRIVTYRGSLAHTIYSSNCGGRTQSGRDLSGWGDVPYWSGAVDGDGPDPGPRSPWRLRRWLQSWPPAYCKPSAYVHPSHFRWTRVVPFKDLQEKLNRRLHVGTLLEIRPLRRSLSGNVNAVLIRGSRRRVKVTSEMEIRGLLSIGSLRSTLFVMDADYGLDRKPADYIFYGGGWGHGVGLCQSGAMGRAETGEDYARIIKAYFKGTELGQLAY